MQHEEWQALLNAGNQLYQKEKWSEAELFYNLAYQMLRKQRDDQPLNCDLLMAWICTCHNLSSLFEQKEDLKAQVLELTLLTKERYEIINKIIMERLQWK